jgi:hypothetical protein
MEQMTALLLSLHLGFVDHDYETLTISSPFPNVDTGKRVK